MDLKVVEAIAKKYGLAFAKILSPQKGYRNSSYPILLDNNTWVNLILYKSEPEILPKIKDANAVSDFLAKTGLPTRTTLGRIIRVQSIQAVKYAALYTYLAGHTIPWEAYTMDHLKELGKTMSVMHARLTQSDYRPATDVTNELLGLLGRMQRYFASQDVQSAMRKKLGFAADLQALQTYAALIEKTRQLPDHQILHMDFVRGNILFEKTTITGILDFEKTAYGPRAFDIARTLAFLLVDCKYKPVDKVTKYFLHSGYNKRGPLEFSDFNLLEELLGFFLLHDLYKFLRHNPYEFLPQNQHFMRTRDILLKRGLMVELKQ